MKQIRSGEDVFLRDEKMTPNMLLLMKRERERERKSLPGTRLTQRQREIPKRRISEKKKQREKDGQRLRKEERWTSELEESNKQTTMTLKPTHASGRLLHLIKMEHFHCYKL